MLRVLHLPGGSLTWPSLPAVESTGANQPPPVDREQMCRTGGQAGGRTGRPRGNTCLFGAICSVSENYVPFRLFFVTVEQNYVPVR